MKTKIHTKSYDFTNFNHPGGNKALELIENKDGTCLFELYHPFSKRNYLNTVLRKYESVDDNSIETQNEFDFDLTNDNFTNEIRDAVTCYFKSLAKKNKCSLIEATKMNTFRIMENCIILGLLYCSLNHFFFFAIFHFLFIVNNWHDAGHFALIQNKFWEEIFMSICASLYPPYSWYNGHTHNHHAYTNILFKDQDIHDKVYLQKGKIPVPFNFLLKVFYSNNENDIFDLAKNINVQTALHICTKSLLLWHFSYKMIFIFIIQIIMFGFVTQINHIHVSNFTRNRHFFKHQIETSSNVKSQSYLMRLFSGGLNMQIEHHLFPSVNSCHLSKLAEIIKPICLKYGVRYNEYDSFYECVKSTLNDVSKISMLKKFTTT